MTTLIYIGIVFILIVYIKKQVRGQDFFLFCDLSSNPNPKFSFFSLQCSRFFYYFILKLFVLCFYIVMD